MFSNVIPKARRARAMQFAERVEGLPDAVADGEVGCGCQTHVF